MEKKKLVRNVKNLFTHEFLTDILCSASYGSSWFYFGTHQDTPKSIYEDAKTCYECREDIWAYILLHDGFLVIEDIEEEEEHKISLKDIIKGFKIVMLNYPQQYADIMEENGDYYDYDAVIQCAVFGDIVYG